MKNLIKQIKHILGINNAQAQQISEPSLLEKYVQFSQAPADWQNHVGLAPFLHEDFKNDVQVIIHEGSYKNSKKYPELLWVRLLATYENYFIGELLDMPQYLNTIQKGDELLFSTHPNAQYPFLVSETYMLEREQWHISPCNACGFNELFDMPADLMAQQTKNSSFTTHCAFCGGLQSVQHLAI